MFLLQEVYFHERNILIQLLGSKKLNKIQRAKATAFTSQKCFSIYSVTQIHINFNVRTVCDIVKNLQSGTAKFHK